MLEKLEKLTAFQDRLFQRWLERSQPCKIDVPEMLESLKS